MQTPIPVSRAKTLARSLKTALAAHDVKLGYSACLEIVAAQHGYDSYNALAALNPQDDSPAAPVSAGLDGFDDLDLTEELRRRGWLFAARTTVDAIAERFPELERTTIAQFAPRIEDAAGKSSIPEIFREIEARILDQAVSEDGDTDPSDLDDPRLANVGQLASRELRRLVTSIATSFWDLPAYPEIAELRLHPVNQDGDPPVVEPLAADGVRIGITPADFDAWARTHADHLRALDQHLRGLNFPESGDRLPSISMPGPLDPLIFPKGIPAPGAIDPEVQHTDIYYLRAPQTQTGDIGRAVERLRRLRPELFPDTTD